MQKLAVWTHLLIQGLLPMQINVVVSTMYMEGALLYAVTLFLVLRRANTTKVSELVYSAYVH